MATMVGGILGVFLFSYIWEWVVFKRVLNNPLLGKTLSVVFGYLTCAIVWGFTSTHGTGWNPSGFVIYALGLAIAGFFFVKRGMQLRDDQLYAGDDVGSTFD